IFFRLVLFQSKLFRAINLCGLKGTYYKMENCQNPTKVFRKLPTSVLQNQCGCVFGLRHFADFLSCFLNCFLKLKLLYCTCACCKNRQSFKKKRTKKSFQIFCNVLHTSHTNLTID